MSHQKIKSDIEDLAQQLNIKLKATDVRGSFSQLEGKITNLIRNSKGSWASNWNEVVTENA